MAELPVLVQSANQAVQLIDPLLCGSKLSLALRQFAAVLLCPLLVELRPENLLVIKSCGGYNLQGHPDSLCQRGCRYGVAGAIVVDVPVIPAAERVVVILLLRPVTDQGQLCAAICAESQAEEHM